jgi:hypothetical protein
MLRVQITAIGLDSKRRTSPSGLVVVLLAPAKIQDSYTTSRDTIGTAFGGRIGAAQPPELILAVDAEVRTELIRRHDGRLLQCTN